MRKRWGKSERRKCPRHFIDICECFDCVHFSAHGRSVFSVTLCCPFHWCVEHASMAFEHFILNYNLQLINISDCSSKAAAGKNCWSERIKENSFNFIYCLQTFRTPFGKLNTFIWNISVNICASKSDEIERGKLIKLDQVMLHVNGFWLDKIGNGWCKRLILSLAN